MEWRYSEDRLGNIKGNVKGNLGKLIAMKNQSIFSSIIGALLSTAALNGGAASPNDKADTSHQAERNHNTGIDHKTAVTALTGRLADDDLAYVVAQLMADTALYTTQSFEWLDASRNRAVPAKLYLPTKTAGNKRKAPLVVFSHGIGGSRDGYKYLGSYLATQGYAVLHLQHVGSDRQVWFGNPFALVARLTTAAQASEAVDRVRDFSFALDQLLASPLAARINSRRIVAAGHSYGANTTMLAVGARVELDSQTIMLRDVRVKAAILLSAPPFYGTQEIGTILRDIDVPTLHITATADDIQIPGYYSGVADRLKVYEAIGSRYEDSGGVSKVLAVFKGGSHSIFTDRLGTGGAALNPRVKLATRELAVSFLNRVFQIEEVAPLATWQKRHGALVDTFQGSWPT
jgi:dienelactone hydrolase